MSTRRTLIVGGASAALGVVLVRYAGLSLTDWPLWFCVACLVVVHMAARDPKEGAAIRRATGDEA